MMLPEGWTGAALPIVCPALRHTRDTRGVKTDRFTASFSQFYPAPLYIQAASSSARRRDLHIRAHMPAGLSILKENGDRFGYVADDVTDALRGPPGAQP